MADGLVDGRGDFQDFIVNPANNREERERTRVRPSMNAKTTNLLF
jgi:hypothetical protein